jgi:DNA modification methylase
MEMTYQLHLGDCLEVLAGLPDNSVDSIVTDPPYGLSFMGKRWDYDVPSVAIWEQCLRVLKPGGHLLAFAGTRTQHRMAVRIEDAGFEIRDMIAWVYGSGFPKSLDVSKAIDRMDSSQEQERRRLRFTSWVRSQGVTSRQIDEATGTNMGGHYTTASSQPAIMTREHLEACRHLFHNVPEWVERETDVRSIESQNMANRQVIGSKPSSLGGTVAAGDRNQEIIQSHKNKIVPITAPATPAAREWSGWGTALKPALEPITMARKPLIGTVAENVLTHGTGAINVDGCRVGDEVRVNSSAGNKDLENRKTVTPISSHKETAGRECIGRWPANLIHDGSNEACLALKSGARFFYSAKTGKDDRETDNNHPTVKPTTLMAYLCRLVTPPGGTVLDPFMGSGSTGKAATVNGFRFIGIERDPAYHKIAEARISNQHQGRLL